MRSAPEHAATPPRARRAARAAWLRYLPAATVLFLWLLAPVAPSRDRRILSASAPEHFSLLDWETTSLAQRFGRLVEGLLRVERADPDDRAEARAFLAAPSAERARGSSAAEGAIERLIAAAYQEAGVRSAWPLLGERLFPPVLLALGPPPNVLVVSPRTELRVVQSVLLDPRLTVPRMEALERSADSTGVSSLATSIGGIATYPAIVPDNQSPRDLLVSAAHEWLHQYLFFFPLGADYFSSQEAREINETTADLVGTEIGERVLVQLGFPLPPPPGPAPSDGFDFRAFMRATRTEVDRLLADGQVGTAERYMDDRRRELGTHGYAIRKLNQAYFAFYGSYGEGAAASAANPVPGLLRTLRGRSPTLGDFLARVREVTSVQELRAIVAGSG